MIINKKFLAISVIAFGLVSCEGESTDSMDTFNENDNLKSKFLNVQPNSHLREYYDNGDPDGKWGEDWGCAGTGGNCLETIIIDIPRISKKTFNTVIQKIIVGDKEEIRKHFTKNEKEIEQMLDTDLVKGVIGSKLFVTHKGDDFTFVLLFKDTKDNVVFVQPFVK